MTAQLQHRDNRGVGNSIDVMQKTSEKTSRPGRRSSDKGAKLSARRRSDVKGAVSGRSARPGQDRHQRHLQVQEHHIPHAISLLLSILSYFTSEEKLDADIP